MIRKGYFCFSKDMNGGLLSGWLESIFVTINKSFLKNRYSLILGYRVWHSAFPSLCDYVSFRVFLLVCVPTCSTCHLQPFPLVCVCLHSVCTHMCVRICMCVHMCVHVCVHVCVYTCVRVHMCVSAMLHFSPFRVFCSFTVSFSFTLCHSFPSRILQRQQNPPLTGLLSADQMSSEQRLGPDMFCRGAGQAWKAQRGNLEGERDAL